MMNMKLLAVITPPSIYYYIPLSYAYSFSINITIAAMNEINSRVLDVGNGFQDKKFQFVKYFVSFYHLII